jgi:HCOMODA/2-hydroxy-3-carboxy-muconic semialdehyde decarboxylase
MRSLVLFTRVGVCAAFVMAMAVLWSSVLAAGQDTRVAGSGANPQTLDDLVAGNRILANEGILDGLGHISVRHDQRPDRFLLSRDLAPALVTPSDFIEYDLQGDPVSANAPRGYQERFIHAAIYRARSDVGSVVHAHTPSVVTFSASSVPLRPMYHVAAFLLPGVPIYEIRKIAGHEGMLVNDVRTGTALAETLGNKAVALMRGHGYVAVGAVIPEAVHRSIVLDVNARMQTQATALGGTINYLTSADVAPGADRVPSTPMGEYMRGWAFWKERAMRK